MTLTALPSLDELAAQPERAAELPVEAAAALKRECEVLIVQYQGLRDALFLRAFACNGASQRAALFDDIDEASRLVGRAADWIYRHHRELPFVIQEGRGRRLRFSRSAITRYLKERAGIESH